MANKEDKKYLLGQFRCEKCGNTLTGPCNCVCPRCGHKMFEDMMWRCCQLLEYSMACLDAVYTDQGQTLTEEQEFQLQDSKCVDFLHDARIMIADGWNFVNADLEEINTATEAYRNSGLKVKNVLWALFAVAGIILGVILLKNDTMVLEAVLLLILSLLGAWSNGKSILEDMRGQTSKDELLGILYQNKDFQRKLGALDDVSFLIVKIGALADDAETVAENLNPDAKKLFHLVLRDSKPYTKQILEGLRDGNRTVDEVVDSVCSIKRL